MDWEQYRHQADRFQRFLWGESYESWNVIAVRNFLKDGWALFYTASPFTQSWLNNLLTFVRQDIPAGSEEIFELVLLDGENPSTLLYNPDIFIHHESEDNPVHMGYNDNEHRRLTNNGWFLVHLPQKYQNRHYLQPRSFDLVRPVQAGQLTTIGSDPQESQFWWAPISDLCQLTGLTPQRLLEKFGPLGREYPIWQVITPQRPSPRVRRELEEWRKIKPQGSLEAERLFLIRQHDQYKEAPQFVHLDTLLKYGNSVLQHTLIPAGLANQIAQLWRHGFIWVERIQRKIKPEQRPTQVTFKPGSTGFTVAADTKQARLEKRVNGCLCCPPILFHAESDLYTLVVARR